MSRQNQNKPGLSFGVFALWLVLGLLGAHNVARGEWKSFCVKVVLAFLSLFATSVGFGSMSDYPELAAGGMIAGAFFLAVLFVYWLVDLVRMLRG